MQLLSLGIVDLDTVNIYSIWSWRIFDRPIPSLINWIGFENSFSESCENFQIKILANINAKVNIIYQKISDLHASCPDHQGDWYFTGNYPTTGGNRVVNKSFINYIEGKNERAY